MLKINLSYPRFKSRKFFNKLTFDFKFKNSEIYCLLKTVSKKDIILDYSQLRIALLHYLNEMLPKGSRVATTAYTIFDMVNIILNADKIPVFVDINEDNLGPDINKLIELVVNKKVACIIYTYLHGYNCKLEKLAKICKEFNCILIEDCAQSLWIDYEKSPGSYGDVALYSTGLFKNINTISGGFLCLNSNNKKNNKLIKSHLKLKNTISKEFIKRTIYALFFKMITSKLFFSFLVFPVLKYGAQKDLEIINKRAREENNPKYINRNNNDILRMNLVQKLLIIMKTKSSISLDYFKKRKLVKNYLIELRELLEIGIISIPGLKDNFKESNFKKFSTYNQIPLLCKNRDDLISFLFKNNIDIAAQHIKDLSSLDLYKDYAHDISNIAIQTTHNILLLPCYPDYPILKAKEIGQLINVYYNQRSNYEFK